MNVIQCTNCKTTNSILNPKCKNCGSFLQPRVPNLNLFDTMWQTIEKPKEAFLKICLAEQKNYVFLLFAITGIGLIFTTYWYCNIGERYSNLLDLLLAGIFIGPFIGVIIFYIFSYLSFLISVKLFKGESTHRNMRAVAAYSLVPVVFATIFILPAELIVFGLYFFTQNPSPQMYKPEAFYALISLDSLSILYSVILFFIGSKVSNNTNTIKTLFMTIILLAVFLCLTIIPMEFIKAILH